MRRLSQYAIGDGHHGFRSAKAEQRLGLCLGLPPSWRRLSQQLHPGPCQNQGSDSALYPGLVFLNPPLSDDDLEIARQGRPILMMIPPDFCPTRRFQRTDDHKQNKLRGADTEWLKRLVMDGRDDTGDQARPHQDAGAANLLDEIPSRVSGAPRLHRFHMMHLHHCVKTLFPDQPRRMHENARWPAETGHGLIAFLRTRRASAFPLLQHQAAGTGREADRGGHEDGEVE